MGSVLTLADPPAPGEVGQGSAVRAGEQQLGGAGGVGRQRFGSFGKGFSTPFLAERGIQQRSAISHPYLLSE